MKFREISAALIGLAFLTPAAQAANDDAGFYGRAERFFNWAEKTYGAQLQAPSNPVSDEDNGYYFRCYQSTLCLGVRADGYVYFYDGKAISRLNPLDSYLQGVEKPPVRLIGTLEGKFADDVAAFFDLTSYSGATPLLLGKGALTSRYLDIVASVVKAGLPVVLINPSEAEINQLRGLAGLPPADLLPIGVSNVDAYALDTNAEGDVYDFILLPDVAPPPGVARVVGLDLTTLVYNDNLSSTQTNDAEPDSAGLQSARLRLLADWLALDGMRNLPNLRTAQVRSQLNGFAADPFKNMEDIVKSTESRFVWRFWSNVHTLTTNVWSVHNRTLNEDWFWVRQQGLFSAANAIHADKDTDRGRFTSYYGVDTFVEGWDNNTSVFLSQSSPETIQKTAKATSSMTWNLSGELNGSFKLSADKDPSGEAGGGGKISGGISVNSSYSYDIPDVAVINQSGTRVNNAGWAFEIARPYYNTIGFGCLGELGTKGLGPMAQVSRGTFLPVMQWLWRVGSDVRAALPNGLPIRINFKTRIGHIYFGRTCVWNLTDWSNESSGLTGQMTVPWPPL